MASIGTPPSGAMAMGGTPPSAPTGGSATGGGPQASGLGGDMGDGATDSALVEYLLANRGDATWIVAVTSANSAGAIELATGAPVMAMGGFTGSDPAPTLAELQSYVASGELRYVIVGGQGGGMGGPDGASTTATGTGEDGSASTRNAWVTANCTQVDDAGTGTSTLYDCAGTVTTGG